jgi:quercetin dioxygenase-like cupin family protein
MGANIKIKKFHETALENEHSRGMRTILVKKDVGSEVFSHVDHAAYYAGGYCPVHTHDHSEEIFLFTRGTGTFFLGDEEIPYEPGTQICVPKGVRHGLKCDDEDITEHVVCCVFV